MNEIDTHVSVTVMGYMAAFCVTLSLISGEKKKKKSQASPTNTAVAQLCAPILPNTC